MFGIEVNLDCCKKLKRDLQKSPANGKLLSERVLAMCQRYVLLPVAGWKQGDCLLPVGNMYVSALRIVACCLLER